MTRRAVVSVGLALVLASGCGRPTSAAGGEPGGRASDAEEDLDLALPRARLEAVPRTGLGDVVPASTREVAAPPDPAPRAGGTAALPTGARATAVTQRVQSITARALSEARKASKGKVDGGNTTIAVHLRPVLGGDPLVALKADAPVVPASNLKVLTVATALELLGPDGLFVTVFEAHGDVRAGKLVGDLVVRAGGDPFYGLDAGGSIEPWLDSLASSLRAAGIQAIEGQLVLDDSAFEAPGIPSGWPAASDHWQAYCARSGGFTANAGCLTATVTPTRAGSAARVALFPQDPGLDLRLDVKTGKRRSGNDVRVGANVSSATVRGSLAEGESPFSVDFAHPSPRDLFGSAFVGGLGRRGVSVARGYVVEARPARGREVARLATPIATTFVPILRDSNNPVADQLYFATAYAHSGRGDRAAGADAMRAALRRLGVDDAGLVAVDGSGLSKTDRCTAAQLTAVLAALARGPAPAFEAYFAALPVAGESGKVSTRMRGTAAAGRVRAKTGFVNGASSLSGYVDTLDGGRLAFSIIVNYPLVSGLNNVAWKPMQDELCALFAELPTR